MLKLKILLIVYLKLKFHLPSCVLSGYIIYGSPPCFYALLTLFPKPGNPPLTYVQRSRPGYFLCYDLSTLFSR